MKLRYILGAALSLSLGLTVSSCIDDDSTYGVAASTPTLTVNGNAAGDKESVQVVNSYFGEEFVIDPQIEYDGDGELQYEWGIAMGSRAGDAFEVVSRERVFRYMFPVGGTWIVQLKVTDGVVGFAQQYTAQINRTFEAGYCVLSNDASGKGNLVFLKEMTPEEIEAGIESKVVENILDVVTKEEDGSALAGLRRLRFPTSATEGYYRIVVSTAKYCYFLEPSSFEEMTALAYGNTIGGFNADNIYGGYGKILAYDSQKKRYVTVNCSDMLPYEESGMKGHTFDAVFGGNYISGGTVNYENYYVDRSPLKVYNMYMEYDENWDVVDRWGCSDGVINDGKPLFSGESLITAFMGEVQITIIEYPWGDYPMENYPAYFITTDGSNNYCTYLSGFGSYSMNPVALESRVTLSPGSAMPGIDTQVVPSVKYHRTYYYNGNRVYVMLFLEDGSIVTPVESQWALQFPDDEEITFMGMDTESTADEEVLMVATVTKSTGRGNVYLYDPRNVRTDNPGVKPSATYKNCADRIFEIMYKGRY